MTTKEDVPTMIGNIIYHGTSKQWVDESIRTYGRVQSGHFRGEPEESKCLSVSFDLEESLAYAIRHAHKYNAEGSVLIIPFTPKLAERFDLDRWNECDAPFPFFLSEEFSQYVVGRIPTEIAQILGKEESALYQMIDDLDEPEFDVNDLGTPLTAFCKKQVLRMRKKVLKLHPSATFYDGEVSGIGVLKYLEENGAICEDFTTNFGNFS